MCYPHHQTGPRAPIFRESPLPHKTSQRPTRFRYNTAGAPLGVKLTVPGLSTVTEPEPPLFGDW